MVVLNLIAGVIQVFLGLVALMLIVATALDKPIEY